jgi:hypothetical protein
MNDASLSSRIYWFNHQGVNVLMMDFTRASPAESLALMDQFPVFIKDQPEASVRMLTDVTESSYEPSIANKWKAIRLQHDAMMRASAVIGLSGLVGVSIRSFIELLEFLNIPRANRKVRIFKTKDQALAWLVKA